MGTTARRRLLAVLLTVALVAGGVVVWKATMTQEQLTGSDPTAAQWERFAATRVFFGHQSVGANVLTGLAALGHDAIVESSVAVPGQDGMVLHAFLGTNGDPQSKLDAFVDVIDGGMDAVIDVAILKFCYVDVDAGTDVAALVNSYTEVIAALQSRHPDITFLYATVPLTTARDLKATVKSWIGRDAGMGPEDNVARQEFNAEMRRRFGNSDLLFDIAAVEAGIDKGVSAKTHSGHDYYVLNDSFAADPGRLNAQGARAAASEFVRTVNEAVE